MQGVSVGGFMSSSWQPCFDLHLTLNKPNYLSCQNNKVESFLYIFHPKKQSFLLFLKWSWQQLTKHSEGLSKVFLEHWPVTHSTIKKKIKICTYLKEWTRVVSIQHFNTEPLLDCIFISFFLRLYLLLLAACYTKKTKTKTLVPFSFIQSMKRIQFERHKNYFYTKKVILKELLWENLTYLYMVHRVSFKDLKKNSSIRTIYSR